MVFKTIFFTVIIFVFASCAAKEPVKAKPQTVGDETFKLTDEGIYTLSCNDAKSIGVVIDALNKDFVAHPELVDNPKDKKTPSMKNFESSLAALKKEIENKFIGDKAVKDEALKDIGAEVTKILQVNLYKNFKIVSEDDYIQFIEVTFCGATPKPGYKSPSDLKPEDLIKALPDAK